jgi:adenosine deaminase
MNDNFIAIAEALDLSNEELKQLAINSFEASFITDTEKEQWINQIRALV